MNLISRISLVLSMCSVCTLAACGGAAVREKGPAFSSVDDASWRPAEAAEMKFAPRIAAASPSTHEGAPPVALKPNPRQNLHGLLNTAH